HTRSKRDWSSDVCSSDLGHRRDRAALLARPLRQRAAAQNRAVGAGNAPNGRGSVRVEGRYVVSPEAAGGEHARRQNARARKGVADRSAGTGRMDDREDRSDRQSQGGAGTVRRRRFRRLHRQYQAHVKPMKKSLVALTLVLAAAGVFRLKAEATGTGLRAGLRAESRGFRLQAEESASDPGNGDWPMWGGTPDRN